MNPKLMIAFLLPLSLNVGSVEQANADKPLKLSNDTTLRFATLEESRQVLGADDDFSARLTEFDLQSRLFRTDEAKRTDYLQAMSDSAVAWSDEQKESLQKPLADFSSRITPLNLPMPKEILLVQATCETEAEAPHTRGNAIILPPSKAKPSGGLQKLLAHELFHIVSRHDHTLRDKLYKVIGYEACGELKLTDELEKQRLTNPDAPIVQHFVRLKLKGKEIPVAQVLMSRSGPYAGQKQSFFTLMKMVFVELEETQDTWKVKSTGDGKPVLHSPSVLGGFTDKVGINTGYIIHPEEILADNFSFLVVKQNVPNPRIVQRIQKIITDYTK